MKHPTSKARFRATPVLHGLLTAVSFAAPVGVAAASNLVFSGENTAAGGDTPVESRAGLRTGHVAGKSREAIPAPSSEKRALARLLTIENERNAKAPFLVEALRDESPRIAGQAALVMGRIGDASFEPLLIEALERSEVSVRRSASFALGLLGSAKGHDALRTQLEVETQDGVRQVLWQAFGRFATRDDFITLSKAIESEKGALARQGAIEGLSQLWLREREEWGPQPRLFERLMAVAGGSDLAAEMAAVTLARFRGDRTPNQVEPLARLHASALNETVRLFSVRALGGVKSESTVEALERVLEGKAAAPIRVEVALAAGRQDWGPQVEALFERLLSDTNPRVVVQATQAVTAFAEKAASLAPRLQSLAKAESRTAQERKNAHLALSVIAPVQGVALSKPLFERALSLSSRGLGGLSEAHKALLLTSIDVMSRLWEGIEPKARPEDPLFELLLSSEPSLAAAAAEGLAHVAAAKTSAARLARDPGFVGHLAQAFKQRDYRVACHLSDVIKAVPKVELAGDLLLAWEAFPLHGDNEGRLCLIESMAVLAPLEGAPKSALLEHIERAVGDPVAPVASRAAQLRHELTGSPAKRQPRAASTSSFPTPSRAEVQEALSSEITFVTSRGPITMRPLPAAPLTAVHVVRLARQGFYDGLSFHRVVPNFVVQGGDPRGDGWGGPGFLVRDEVSLVSHAPGTVGIATSGKDTGGSQFFVNEAHNFHLNGTYTVFARMTRGMDVVRGLTEGDRISKVEVRTGTQ